MNTGTVPALGFYSQHHSACPRRQRREVLKPTLDVSDMRIIILYISTGIYVEYPRVRP